MGYESHWTGEVRIEPPLTWGEIKNNRQSPGFQDLKLRLEEQVTETDTGQTKVITAGAVIPIREEAYNGYSIEEELSAFVAEFGDRHTVAGRIEALGPEGDQWAYVVADGAVTRVEPAVVWPDGSTGQQHAESRANALREAVAAVRAERLTDNTGTPEDEAYNRAIDDAIRAVQALTKED